MDECSFFQVAPKDAIDCILQHLPLLPDVVRMARVCRRLSEVVRTSGRWKRVSIQGALHLLPSPATFLEHLRRMHKYDVEDLDLSISHHHPEAPLLLDNPAAIMRSFPNLKRLSLASKDDERGRYDAGGYGLDELCKFTNLEVLNLRGFNNEEYGLLELLRATPSLRVLILTNAECVGEATLRALHQLLPQLEVLDVSGTEISTHPDKLYGLLEGMKDLRIVYACAGSAFARYGRWNHDPAPAPGPVPLLEEEAPFQVIHANMFSDPCLDCVSGFMRAGCDSCGRCERFQVDRYGDGIQSRCAMCGCPQRYHEALRGGAALLAVEEARAAPNPLGRPAVPMPSTFPRFGFALSAVTDPNSMMEGMTLLHYQVMHGTLEGIELLVNVIGCDPSVLSCVGGDSEGPVFDPWQPQYPSSYFAHRYRHGFHVGGRDGLLRPSQAAHFSALHLAAFYARADVIGFLVSCVDVDVRDSQGATPLMYAVVVEQVDLAMEAVRALLLAGADPNAQDEAGLSVLGRCMLNTGRCMPVVRLLLDSGASPLGGFGGPSPLLMAGQHQEEAVVRFLAQEAAATAASMASSTGQPVVLSNAELGIPQYLMGCWAGEGPALINILELLGDSVDLSAPNKGGRTPLHAACELGEAAIVQWLLTSLKRSQQGTKWLDVKDMETGSTALHIACGVYVPEMLPRANNYDPRRTRPTVPVNSRIVRLLVEAGADPCACNATGASPLLCLVASNAPHKLEACNALLDAGAKACQGDHEGLTPLHAACLQTQPKVLRKLLDSPGVDVNQADRHGVPALLMLLRLWQSCAYFVSSQEMQSIGDERNAYRHRHAREIQLFGRKREDLEQCVEALLDMPGLDLCCRDWTGSGVLHLAAGCDLKASLADRLVCATIAAASASGEGLLAVMGPDVYGDTPLHCLCRRCSSGNLSGVMWRQLLVTSAGQEALGRQGFAGETPLHILLSSLLLGQASMEPVISIKVTRSGQAFPLWYPRNRLRKDRADASLTETYVKRVDCLGMAEWSAVPELMVRYPEIADARNQVRWDLLARIKELLDMAAPATADAKGRTALHLGFGLLGFMCRMVTSTAFRSPAEIQELIMCLLDRCGALINAQDHCGDTPLHHFVRELGHSGIGGRSTLHPVVEAVQAAVLQRCFAECGAQSMVANREGLTVFHGSMTSGNFGGTLRPLLMHCADVDVNAPSRLGVPPLLLVMRKQRVSWRMGKHQVLWWLLEAGADPCAEYAGMPMIWWALELREVHCAAALLLSGRVDLQALHPREGTTCLEHAVCTLLQRVDPSEADSYVQPACEQPLFWMELGDGPAALVRLMLSLGASLGDKDAAGTPLRHKLSPLMSKTLQAWEEARLDPSEALRARLDLQPVTRYAPLKPAELYDASGQVKVEIEPSRTSMVEQTLSHVNAVKDGLDAMTMILDPSQAGINRDFGLREPAGGGIGGRFGRGRRRPGRVAGGPRRDEEAELRRAIEMSLVAQEEEVLIRSAMTETTGQEDPDLAAVIAMSQETAMLEGLEDMDPDMAAAIAMSLQDAKQEADD